MTNPLKRLLPLALLTCSGASLLAAADGSWLRRVPAADHARINPLAAEPSAAAAGSHLYSNECSKCHGDQAQGKGSRPALTSPRIAQATDGDLFWLLKNGNPWKGMPAWSTLPDAQRWQIVAYIRSLNPPSTSTPSAPSPESPSK